MPVEELLVGVGKGFEKPGGVHIRYSGNVKGIASAVLRQRKSISYQPRPHSEIQSA